MQQEVADMTVQLPPHQVKQLVVRTFLELGLAQPSLFGLKETIFVDGGRCLARSYRVETLQAVWDIDAGIIRFVDSAGHVLRTVNLLEEVTPQLMAA